MFKCECGREFSRPQALSYHKKYCGNYEEFLDGGYKAKIGPDGKMFYIHRNIMEQKLGRKLKPGELVHHKDEDKLNNDPDNLELTDVKKHCKHHYKPIPRPKKILKGECIGTSKLIEQNVIEIKKLLNQGQKSKDIAKKYNVSYDAINFIKNGTTWRHVEI